METDTENIFVDWRFASGDGGARFSGQLMAVFLGLESFACFLQCASRSGGDRLWGPRGQSLLIEKCSFQLFNSFQLPLVWLRIVSAVVKRGGMISDVLGMR
jgi:hypothetical protein